MVNKLFVASTTRNKMPPEKSLGIGWDSLKFSFHSLLLLIMLSHQAFVLVLSRIIQIFDGAIVISDKIWRTSILFASPFWFLRNIALSLKIKRLPGPVTERGGYQRPPSMTINTTTTLDFFVWIRHFSYTANSKYRWRKNIRIREKSVYTAKLSGFKSFRIQSFHFRFRIQNLRRHDQTGMFLFRIRPLVCKRQNQSGTKTFRIYHESGTISSSVNLVLMFTQTRWRLTR